MPTPRVLVFTATVGYRHDSITDAIKCLKQRSHLDISFDFTEDGADFTDDNLAQYDGLMFISTMGEILNEEQQEALDTYFRKGGNFIGVHSAACCLYKNEDYRKVVGAHFNYHPQLQPAVFKVLDKTHPSTSHLPDTWRFEEEVYMFRSDPRDNGVKLLLSVEEGSYKDDGKSTGDYPGHGSPHPIAWYNDSIPLLKSLIAPATKSGRSFFTSLGHSSATWEDEMFIKHVLGGLSWALESGSRG